MASSNLISRRRLQLSEILDRNDVIFIKDIRRNLEQIQSCLLLLRHCQLRMEASYRKNLYRNWLLKIRTKGFDYDLNLVNGRE